MDFIFKWVLVIFFLLGTYGSLKSVAKGKYSREESPLFNAVAACVYILIALGIIYWL